MYGWHPTPEKETISQRREINKKKFGISSTQRFKVEKKKFHEPETFLGSLHVPMMELLLKKIING